MIKIAKLLFVFILFYYLDLLHKERVWESIIWYVTSYKLGDIIWIESYDECKKVVHRPYSSYISSIQKLNENSIEFFLSTWTRSSFKVSQSKSLQEAYKQIKAYTIFWSSDIMLDTK